MRKLGSLVILASLLAGQTGCQLSIGMTPGFKKEGGPTNCPHCGGSLDEPPGWGKRNMPARPRWSQMDQGQQPPDGGGYGGPMPPGGMMPGGMAPGGMMPGGMPPGYAPQRGGESGYMPGAQVQYPQGPMPRMANGQQVIPTLPPNTTTTLGPGQGSRGMIGPDMSGMAPRPLPSGVGEGPYGQ